MAEDGVSDCNESEEEDEVNEDGACGLGGDAELLGWGCHLRGDGDCRIVIR